MIHKNSPSYSDLTWDTMLSNKREKIALEQFKKTAIIAKKTTAFYKEHYSKFSEKNIMDMETLEQCAIELPQLTKSHLSLASNKPTIFIPQIDNNEKDINKGRFRNKGTGGTTGRPVTIFYSPQDWKAMAQHIARSIKFDFKDNPEALNDLVVAGLYHGDHVTNEVYQSGLSLLGIDMLNRVSTKPDAQSNYDLIQQVKPNAILAPPEDATNRQTKGITLDTILKLDARNFSANKLSLNHNINPNFKAIFWSSMPISPDLQNYILEYLGIPYQQAQYGSTEICPTGATCSKHPRDFHLGYGPTLVQLIHPNGNRITNEGEEGYVLASKIGATNEQGLNQVPMGTMLLNLRTGDLATLLQTKGKLCECGRNTPVLYGIRRVEDIQAKLDFGCQVS